MMWGETAPWDSFQTEAGWEISFGLQLAPQMVDGLGTVDMTLQSLDVTASAIPVGPTEAHVLAGMQMTAALGASIATANDLVITGTGVYLALTHTGLVDADLGYGAQRKRIGQCQWIATRNVTAGTADPLFFIGTEAPE